MNKITGNMTGKVFVVTLGLCMSVSLMASTAMIPTLSAYDKNAGEIQKNDDQRTSEEAQAIIEQQRARRAAIKEAEKNMTKEEKAEARQARLQANKDKLARMSARREASRRVAEKARKERKEKKLQMRMNAMNRKANNVL